MTEQYFKDREPSEQPVFESLLHELQETIPERSFQALPYLSFIMLKPDAYLRGLIPEILTSLAENGVYPVRLSLQQLEASHIDNLYRFVKPKYYESWWIMDKIYRLSPCCPAIVVGKPEGYPHLSARIRELVGPTTPLLGNESQVRYRFRGAHRIFNLIHGTDDPAAAMREALVFFGLDDLKRSLEQAAALAQENTPPRWTLPDIRKLIPAHEINLDYPYAKYNLKSLLQQRCDAELASIKERPSPEAGAKQTKLVERLHALLLRFANLLQEEKGLIDAHHPPREERRLLIYVYYPQLRTIALAGDSISEAIVEFSRDSAMHSDRRRSILSSLSVIESCIKIARALTTDVELKGAPLDTYLSWLALLGIPVSEFVEANLHAAWSVLPTEFADFELKHPGLSF